MALAIGRLRAHRGTPCIGVGVGEARVVGGEPGPLLLDQRVRLAVDVVEDRRRARGRACVRQALRTCAASSSASRSTLVEERLVGQAAARQVAP